jgi:transposase
MDNASIHHSKKFNAKPGEWITEGLRIFHLPPYSPHLNIIETLWRKIKYEWLKPGDYDSWEKLIKALENILTSVGKDFKIMFGELTHFKKFKSEKVSII